jgi:hypothetical protein
MQLTLYRKERKESKCGKMVTMNGMSGLVWLTYRQSPVQEKLKKDTLQDFASPCLQQSHVRLKGSLF